jgi:hypothetical protein
LKLAASITVVLIVLIIVIIVVVVIVIIIIIVVVVVIATSVLFGITRDSYHRNSFLNVDSLTGCRSMGSVFDVPDLLNNLDV